MGRAMVLGRAQERGVIAKTEMRHQLRDELVRRQTAEAPILGRNDDVEASVGSRELTLLGEPSQGGASPDDGTPERVCGLLGREVVATSGSELCDQGRS